MVDAGLHICGNQPTKFMVDAGLHIDAPSLDGGTMCASKPLSLEMAHGAITAGLGLPLITLDSPSVGSIFTVWFDPPNGNSGTIGKDRLPNCATVTLAFGPIESEQPQQRLAQWRNHFSQIASCLNAEFDTVFAAAISDQFRAY